MSGHFPHFCWQSADQLDQPCDQFTNCSHVLLITNHAVWT
jgi:hypothetical protein